MDWIPRRLRRRREAIGTLERLSDNLDNVVAVHYSCESFYDRPQGNSPRITSIAVRNLGSAQTASFSIHQVAEREGVQFAEIANNYDRLEHTMLEEWFEYVKRHVKMRWLHWNMRDINYGFPAIAHRYRVLGGEPVEIEESRLFDFARLLIAIFGPEYAGHPRLESLCRQNEISFQAFLSGKQEAEAFENGEYVKLHQSTLRKVDMIANVYSRYENGSLVTCGKWWEPYGSRAWAMATWVRENPIVTIVLAISTLLSVLFGIMALW